MRVFVTGATGFIGTALVPELKAAGHTVVGLARNDEASAKLDAQGIEVHRGALEEPESLAAGAKASDGVIHLAFDHDFSRWAENGEKDRRAVEAMTQALAGSGKPFVVTSGTAMLPTGKVGVETDPVPQEGLALIRGASETVTLAAATTGVRGIVVRLPQVHDTRKQGLVTPMILTAREKGYAAYVGEGENRFPAAHVKDVASLYRLALEKGEPGAVFHAVAEEGVRVRDIAEAFARRLGLPVRSLKPEEIGDYFGVFAFFATVDNVVSSAITQEALGWTPKERGLLDDLRQCELDG